MSSAGLFKYFNRAGAGGVKRVASGNTGTPNTAQKKQKTGQAAYHNSRWERSPQIREKAGRRGGVKTSKCSPYAQARPICIASSSPQVGDEGRDRKERKESRNNGRWVLITHNRNIGDKSDTDCNFAIEFIEHWPSECIHIALTLRCLSHSQRKCRLQHALTWTDPACCTLVIGDRMLCGGFIMPCRGRTLHSLLPD